MAVTTPKASAGPYIADGLATRFAFDFPVVDTKHVAVYMDGERVTEGFTITGGEVVFSTAPAAEKRIVILRDMPFTQETDLQNNTAFLPEVLEQAFDKLTMICQQLQESDARSVKWLPAMENKPLPEQLLTDAVNAALDVTEIVRQFNTDFTTKSEEINRLTKQANDALADTRNALAGADIMAQDTALSYGSLNWSSEDEWDAVHATAQQIMEEIAALPRNLGGHTLTIAFANWKLTGEEPCIIRIGGFYNGKVIINAPTFYCPVEGGSTEHAFVLRDCQCPVEVRGLAAGSPYATESDHIVAIYNCSAVEVIDADMQDLALVVKGDSPISPNADSVAAIYASNSTVSLANCQISFDTRFEPETVKHYPLAVRSGGDIMQMDLLSRVAALEDKVAALENNAN